ncbi:MAG: hypothetical protein OXI74_05475 [Rhodospirillaceae bacterium]|nr:hypothetical protein [Rhodospirillaceae bacterium]
MSIEEFLTTGIALTALALSSINTYYQFFSVRHSLALASYNLTLRDGEYHAELIVSNTGNKPFTATNIHFCAIDERFRTFEDAGNRTYVDTYVDNVYSKLMPSETQTVIPAGEVRIFRLKASFAFAQNSAMSGRSFNVGVCLTAYTSEAEKASLGIMPFWMTVDSSGTPTHAQRRVEHGIFDKEHRKRIDLSKATLAARGLAR